MQGGMGSLVVLLLAERAPSEGWEGNSQTILLARWGCTIRMCPLNARTIWLLPLGQSEENRKGPARADGTSREIDCGAIGG